MALPILDTTLVTILRAASGRPISQGGRDHLSHRLVALGLNERQAVLLLYVISVAAGTLAIVAHYLGPWISISLGGLLAIGIALFGVYLGQVRIYTEADVERLAAGNGLVGKLVLGGKILYKRQITTMLLDLALACLALSAAYLLRYEGMLEKRFVEQFAQVLPLVVLAKLPLLYFFGVYRSIWRYTGAADVNAIGRAGTLGSLVAAAAAFAIYRGEALNRSVLVLDWALFIMLMVGSRLSFVFIRDLLARLRRHGLTRVLIVGAGDAGELMLRSMNRSRRAYRVLGFLDDDLTKQHLAIHGIPVVGTTDDLARVARQRRADEILIAVGSDERRSRLLEKCRGLGIPARHVGQFFLDQADGDGAPNGRRPSDARRGPRSDKRAPAPVISAAAPRPSAEPGESPPVPAT
jgi:UDP-GlcNAc:undecaprenyl-phosphate GlcNAc-1-phosphate transferase